MGKGESERQGAGRQAGRLGEAEESSGSSRPAGRVAGEDAARTAGRGFMLITGAKLWFMVMGAVVNVGLPILMSPEEFGIYSVVVNAVSLLNMVVITGTIQAVSKLCSERPRDAARIAGRAAMLQWIVGVPLGLSYIFGADLVAGSFNDPSLGGLIRVSGGVILAYGFYAVFVGLLNGIKDFGRQAGLDATFSTLKTALIVGAVGMGFGVSGAIWGFVIASVVVTGMSVAVAYWALRGQRGVEEGSVVGVKEDARKLLTYLVLVMLYTFCVNGVLRVDLFLIKALVGASEAGGVEVSNRVAGVYTAMLNVSRLPYQAVIAVTFVIFPMISQATFEQDTAATRAYIRGALRYSLILLGLLSAVLAGNAEAVVLALYGDRYLSGVFPLMVLSLATVGFALFYIATTMLTGAGRPLASVGISALVLALTAGLNYGLLEAALSSGAVDEAGLVSAASVATASAMIFGFGLSMGYLVWRFKAGMPLGTLWRVSLAGGAVLGFSALAPVDAGWGKVALLGVVAGKALLGALIFGGVLWGCREFGAEDRDRLQRVLRRKKKAA